jgi:tartrate-resistant acid phosphatase type 5
VIRFQLVVLLASLISFSSFARSSGTGFVFFGDWGQGTRGQKAVAQGIGDYCRIDACAFVLALGDNFYPSGVDSVRDSKWKDYFHDVYDFLNLRFYAALGNHDYLGSPRAQIDYTKVSQRWMMPTQYYEYAYGDVHFFVIDTNDFDSRQQAWLAQGLSHSRALWKIVYGHHPIYSTGVHGNTKSLVRDLLPVLKGKADFYLSGHDHHKEALKAEDGVNFLVSGAAAEIRSVKGGPRTEFRAETLGFGHLLVKGNQARVRFVDQTGRVEWEKVYSKGSRFSRISP